MITWFSRASSSGSPGSHKHLQASRSTLKHACLHDGRNRRWTSPPCRRRPRTRLTAKCPRNAQNRQVTVDTTLAAAIHRSEQGVRPCEISARLGIWQDTVNYILGVARRAGVFARPDRSKPNPDGNGAQCWTGVNVISLAAEVADQIIASGLDHGFPVHEIFRLLWLSARRAQVARAVGCQEDDLVRLFTGLRVAGVRIPKAPPGRYTISRLPTDPGVN